MRNAECGPIRTLPFFHYALAPVRHAVRCDKKLIFVFYTKLILINIMSSKILAAIKVAISSKMRYSKKSFNVLLIVFPQ